MLLGFQVAGLVVGAIVLTAIVGYLIEKSPEASEPKRTSAKRPGREANRRMMEFLS